MGFLRRLIDGDPKNKASDALPLPTDEPEIVPLPETGQEREMVTERPVVLPDPWPLIACVSLDSATDVVGTSYYQSAIDNVLGDDYVVHSIAVLVPEPENKFDSNAIGVYVENMKIGHLSRSDGIKLREPIDQAIVTSGFATSHVTIYRAYEHWACIESAKADPMSRPSLIRVLSDAGYEVGASFRTGFDVKVEDQRLRIIWNKVTKEKQATKVTEMAKTLRDLGYSARVVSVTSRPFVNVIGFGGELTD